MSVRKTPTTVNYGPNIPGTNFADLVNIEVSDLWNRVSGILDAVTGTNTISCTTTPTLVGYAKNQEWDLVPQNTNSGPTQINIDGNGLRAVKAADGSALVGGELVAGVMTKLKDTGSVLRMQATVIASVNALTAIFALTKANNTAGGGVTNGARRTYPLNTTTLNEIVGASLNTTGPDINKIVLPAGTYEVDASVGFFATGASRIFLLDETAAADIATVTGMQANDNSNADNAELIGKFSLSVTSTITLQYRTVGSRATDGLGVAANLTEVQQFGYIRFKKVA